MMLFSFFLSLITVKSQHPLKTKEGETENPSIYPRSILINENSDQIWSPYKIDRSGWTATADSEQTTSAGNEGPVSNILDGNTNTIWHSKHSNNGAGGHDREKTYGPFQITINLGKVTTFKAFSYMPRTSGGSNGKFSLYEFYVAQTAEELTTKINDCKYVAKGFIDSTSSLSTLVILPYSEKGQFIALRSLNHDTYGSCAEFNLYSDPSPPTPTPMAIFVDEERDTIWKPYKIDRTGWKATANSEQTTSAGNEGPISNILDGNKNTFWHSKYNNNGAGAHEDRDSNTDPLHFIIDLGKDTTFKDFAYMPRSSSENGRFKHYEFYTAQTQAELDTKMANNNYLTKGDIDHTQSVSTLVIFHGLITARFVALR